MTGWIKPPGKVKTGWFDYQKEAVKKNDKGKKLQMTIEIQSNHLLNQEKYLQYLT